MCVRASVVYSSNACWLLITDANTRYTHGCLKMMGNMRFLNTLAQTGLIAVTIGTTDRASLADKLPLNVQAGPKNNMTTQRRE